MQVTVATTRSNDPEVHAKGCADVTRGRRSGKYQGSYNLEVTDPAEAAAEFWADIVAEGSMTDEEAVSSTRFLPCTRTMTEDELFTYLAECDRRDREDRDNADAADDEAAWTVRDITAHLEATCDVTYDEDGMAHYRERVPA